jgi:aldehyde:ferredoxin oxidoreductase
VSDQSNEIYGYMGKVLYVDMTAKSFKEEQLNKEYTDLLLGGRGFGAAYLFEHFNSLKQGYKNPFKQIDPLSKDNVIVLSSSVTTGTKVPTSGRLHMNFKSPLTNALGSTSGGGHFSVNLKRTGYDVLIISGSSKTPCILIISNGRVDFKDTEEIYPLDSVALRKKIRKEYSKKVQVLSIGEGGRKMCRYASVMTDSGKALGRGGGGAESVMTEAYLHILRPPSPMLST